MPVVTATEVTIYSNISASAATIASSGLISMVQDRINLITNNYFVSNKIYLQGAFTFAPSDTIVSTTNLETEGFASGDEIYLYNSYRNDGYKVTSTISSGTITLATGSTVVSEKSGASILVSLVQWPTVLKQIAARMVAYDYDVRSTVQAGVRSESLGPASKTYAIDSNSYGYPNDIIEDLRPFTMVRLM
jgi:hypothetical protein